MDDAGFWNASPSSCGDAPETAGAPMVGLSANPLRGLYVYRSGSHWLLTNDASRTPSDMAFRRTAANQYDCRP
jgi:hypothetical protein